MAQDLISKIGEYQNNEHEIEMKWIQADRVDTTKAIWKQSRDPKPVIIGFDDRDDEFERGIDQSVSYANPFQASVSADPFTKSLQSMPQLSQPKVEIKG